MRKLHFTAAIASIMVLSALCFAESQANSNNSETCKVSVSITNIKTADGTIIMSIHDSDKSFSRKNPLETLKLSPEVPSVLCTLNLAPGEYAFCVYHDINNNGQLDTNLVGIPKEPFGFSNYNGKSVPGNFKKHKLVISDDCDVIISIFLLAE
ncbi:MAG: DUF2141 domain-containing protein [Spirochaetaceae bacterium]|nr:DUF2141 domain-containing protein [Spirochaetaceae bacterium]